MLHAEGGASYFQAAHLYCRQRWAGYISRAGYLYAASGGRTTFSVPGQVYPELLYADSQNMSRFRKMGRNTAGGIPRLRLIQPAYKRQRKHGQNKKTVPPA